MAQINKQSVLLGSGRSVGTVSVDSGRVRGEGGPVRPQIVVPLTIQMNPRAADSMIAICWIQAWLSTDPNAFPHTAICRPVSESLIPGFHSHSISQAPTEHTADLRFFLTPAEVEDVEQRRHAVNTDIFTLYLGLSVVVAGVKTFNGAGPNPAASPTPWGSDLGMLSEVFPFWTSQVSPVSVAVERSTWIREVLPGLGHDRSRLIEVRLPPPLPEHLSSAPQFDKARRAMDERRYDDCIQECRGLLSMWEKQFGASSQVRLAELVGRDRRWEENDVRRVLFDALWKGVGDVANAPHHPEGDVDSQRFDRRDARLVFILTAALSEYVGS